MNGTHRLAQVPPGVQCFVGEEARRRRLIEEAVVSVFEGWDYGEIIPPLFDYAEAPLAPAAALCGRDAVQLRSAGAPLDLASLAARLRAAGDVVSNPHLVRLRAPEGELVVFADGRAIVKGTADAARARSVYARYVGA